MKNFLFLKLSAALALAVLASSCGKAIPLSKGTLLGAAVVTETGGTRTDGANFGQIYPVTTIVAATSGIPSWTYAGGAASSTAANDFPFTGVPLNIGQSAADRQTAFQFSYSYPPNNYLLADAHLVIDSQRDSSDTEGIFVDGVFSGRPAFQNANSTKITDAIYYPSTFAWPTPAGKNTFVMDWSAAHYKVGVVNSFDLNLVDLLVETAREPRLLLNDGFLPVVTGDDLLVFQANLVMHGYTISRTPLTCSNSPNYNYQNAFLHNDGNSIGAATFNGTVKNPRDSWTGARDPSFQSVEFFYDAALPGVSVDNITLTTGSLAMTLKRGSTGASAIVVNGVGIAQAAFNRANASAVVETWIEDATTIAAWDTFVNSITVNDGTGGASTNATLNLLTLYGASQLKTLLAQGKLNISIGGHIAVVSAGAYTSTRHYGVLVAGPEFTVQGTYFTELCQVPNDPSSPLQDGLPLPPGGLDETSPLVSSVQVAEITATSAVVQWLTDEGASSQVLYGVVSTADNSSPLDATYQIFHRVTLTGLLPYKYYQFQVKSVDGSGNTTLSNIGSFRTLR